MTTGSIVPPPYPIPGAPAEAPVPPVPRPPVPIFGPPTRFMTAWPRDIRSKMTQGALLGGLGAGLAAALCWRSSLPGLGWTLTAFAVALAAFATQKVQWTPTRIGALVLALCLAVVPTVRDAEWLVALCILTSLALFVYALAPARTWTGLVYGQFCMLFVTTVRPSTRPSGWCSGCFACGAGFSKGYRQFASVIALAKSGGAGKAEPLCRAAPQPPTRIPVSL